MGGLVAYLVARKIVQAGLNPPLHIFITGTVGPSSLLRGKKNIHRLPMREFLLELRDLNGCPAEILETPELLAFFEPILRADFQASETYIHSPSPALNIPITVITGSEEDMEMEEVYRWKLESKLPVTFKTMPGDHFFITDSAGEIVNLISEELWNKRNSCHQQ
jgi:surfactin synthase thioesterase subunit